GSGSLRSRMSLDRLVNACLFPGFDGERPPDWLRRAVDDGLGGTVVYGSNVVAAEGRIEQLVEPLRAQRADLLVPLDEEGGDAAHGRAFVEGLQECGVAASAKHFPGHGATRTDSHHALPVIDCDEETFRVRELSPFLGAIEAGVKSIMTAHVVFPRFDELPATLSRRF